MQRRIKTIHSRDESRRVVIFRRNDGTFGFESEHWADEEREWIPYGRQSSCRTDSAEAALVEAVGRVAWLAEERTGENEYRLSVAERLEAPETVGGLPVVCYTAIDGRHRSAGDAGAGNLVGGRDMSLPAGLAICRDDNGSFHLYYCDVEWEPLADSWHPTLEAAKAQADFEFAGASATWEDGPA